MVLALSSFSLSLSLFLSLLSLSLSLSLSFLSLMAVGEPLDEVEGNAVVRHVPLGVLLQIATQTAADSRLAPDCEGVLREGATRSIVGDRSSKTKSAAVAARTPLPSLIISRRRR